MNVEEEVGRLKEEIKRLGKLQSDGSYKVISKFFNFHSFPSDLYREFQFDLCDTLVNFSMLVDLHLEFII